MISIFVGSKLEKNTIIYKYTCVYYILKKTKGVEKMDKKHKNQKNTNKKHKMEKYFSIIDFEVRYIE